MTATALQSYRANDLSKRIPVEELIRSFLSGKSQKTLTAYSNDLKTFSAFVNVGSAEDAAKLLIEGGHGLANLTAIRFKDSMLNQKLAPATINRRLSALRSLISLAKTLGLVDWDIQVPCVKSVSFRDTRGVGMDGFRLLLAAARRQRSQVKVARDVGLLRLLFDLALRRSEVAALNISDVDVQGARLMVVGKGHQGEPMPMTLPDQTLTALKEWISHRGTEPGALFLNCDHARKGKDNSLSDNGIYRIVCRLGNKSFIRARPHGLRHAAITTVLDIMGGNVRVAQRFARHASPDTTLRYDDNRTDLGGSAAKRLAEQVG